MSMNKQEMYNYWFVMIDDWYKNIPIYYVLYIYIYIMYSVTSVSVDYKFI